MDRHLCSSNITSCIASYATVLVKRTIETTTDTATLDFCLPSRLQSLKFRLGPPKNELLNAVTDMIPLLRSN